MNRWQQIEIVCEDQVLSMKEVGGKGKVGLHVLACYRTHGPRAAASAFVLSTTTP
jgi:hypothetical protein